MQFGSKNKRNIWLGMIVGLMPDIIISIGFAWFNNDGSLFFVSLIGLQIIYFLIWLKDAAWNWFLFFRSGRKKIKNHILDYLKKNQYPEPDDYLDSPEAYFLSVSNDEELPTTLRIKAAIELGSIASLAPNGYVQHSMRLALGTEDAIEEYKKTFPTGA